MIRKPAVAGTFYPGSTKRLEAFLEEAVHPVADPIVAVGVVSPHAGYRYSGTVAAAVFGRVEVPDAVVLLGPNHTGRGDAAALMAGGTWEMPQGPVPIHADLAHAILEIAPLVHIDARAHAGEHSLETQLPFLQYFRPQLSIVPLCFKPLSLAACQEIGLELACTVEQAAGPVLIVASTDMSHYETHVTAQRKDALAIAQILRRDARGLYEIAEAEGISMCGLTPVAVMLAAVNRLGATRAQQVGYMTSGEINGDWDRVVGYLGVTIH